MRNYLALLLAFVAITSFAFGQPPRYELGVTTLSRPGFDVRYSLSLRHLESGAELWLFGVNSPSQSFEVISPQLKLGRSTAGVYGRLEDSVWTRFGLAGSLRIGQPAGLQLVSPTYMYRDRSGHWGMLAPNARVTFFVGKGTRLGAGAAISASENVRPSIVLGPYGSLSVEELTIQARLGYDLSTGASSVFFSTSFRF